MTGCQSLTALGRRRETRSLTSEQSSANCLNAPPPLSKFKPSQIVLGAP
jgi:hypothetical protein